MRQSAIQFTRVRQLAPDNLATRLFLAQIYLFYRQPDLGLEALHDPLVQPARFALTEYNSTELNILAASAYFQKNENARAAELLSTEIERHPDNDLLMFFSAQAFDARGLYTNALQVINRKLARSPDDTAWLYRKGFESIQIGAFDEAVTALSKCLELQTNNPSALLTRAMAYYQGDRLDAARADYLKLQAVYTNSFQVARGLGEVAWRQHQTNEAIRNYEIYLANAPTNYLAEIKLVREHLSQLRAP
jgi:tetratricopeptide (TPR) repeat protein